MKDVRKQKYEAPRRRFPASANVTVTAVQERFLGYARNDDTRISESKNCGEAATPNPEPRTPNPEPRTLNPEP